MAKPASAGSTAHVLFKGAAKRIEDIDLPRIAARIGVGEDELHAFMDVEASASGFDRQGRPKMLFEPHIFFRLLGKGPKRDAAVKAGLAYAKWGAKPYPRDSYPRLIQAMAIDEVAALKSASWGLSQILGQWHADCGYPTARAMVEAFMADEEAHLEATVRLLTAWKVDDDLRRLAALKRPTTAEDCAAIAKVWNGEAYAKHDYHGRLAKAHNRWRKIRDTPYVPARAPVPAPKPSRPAPSPAAVVDYTDETFVRVAQENLTRLNYPLGSIDPKTGGFDGIAGDLTKSAIRDFRKDNGLPAGDGIDAELLNAFKTAKPRVLPRAGTSAEEIRATVPEAQDSWLNRWAGGGLAGLAGLGAVISGAIENFATAREAITPYLGYFPGIQPWMVFVIIAAGGGFIYWRSTRAEQSIKGAVRIGARL